MTGHRIELLSDAGHPAGTLELPADAAAELARLCAPRRAPRPEDRTVLDELGPVWMTRGTHTRRAEMAARLSSGPLTLMVIMPVQHLHLAVTAAGQAPLLTGLMPEDLPGENRALHTAAARGVRVRPAEFLPRGETGATLAVTAGQTRFAAHLTFHGTPSLTGPDAPLLPPGEDRPYWPPIIVRGNDTWIEQERGLDSARGARLYLRVDTDRLEAAYRQAREYADPSPATLSSDDQAAMNADAATLRARHPTGALRVTFAPCEADQPVRALRVVCGTDGEVRTTGVTFGQTRGFLLTPHAAAHRSAQRQLEERLAHAQALLSEMVAP